MGRACKLIDLTTPNFDLNILELNYPPKTFCIGSVVQYMFYAGPRSAVGNVSGYRCVSDCRSRGREFDPGPVPHFRGD